jgi:chromate reductase, NAD(P)H dehydrogenase (quinone)
MPRMEFSVETLEDIPFYNEDLDLEPALPPITNFRSKVAASDGIGIATPEYNHGIPGGVKKRARLGITACVRVLLSRQTCPDHHFRAGLHCGVRAQYQLRETLASMQAQVITGRREIVVAGVNARMSHGRFADEESLAFIATGLNRLHEDVLSQRIVAR